MITIVKPIPYLHTTAGIEPSMQIHQLNSPKGSISETREVDFLPAASKVMLPKSREHINFYHSSLSVFLEGAHNLDSHCFLVFQVPAFQNLSKCPCDTDWNNKYSMEWKQWKCQDWEHKKSFHPHPVQFKSKLNIPTKNKDHCRIEYRLYSSPEGAH